jgi:formylglycine-generating enzyme
VQREVTLTKSFEIGVTPVTQLEYALIMRENPSEFKDGGVVIFVGKDISLNPNRPVERVSWEDAQKYIQKLNELEEQKPAGQQKYRYRLPTEAEWEYAARAGTTTAYSHGDSASELEAYAWYDANSGKQTHDVAGLKPNAFGLYDMNGNVRAWTADRFGQLSPDATTDPTGPTSGSERVARGGSWQYEPRGLRAQLIVATSPPTSATTTLASAW